MVLHTGSSHELLPAFLRELAAAGRSADFALVDGDHSAEGVRRDLEDLLDSPGFARGAILIHDIANEEVRRGVDAVRFEGYPKVTHVELDWVPGQMFAQAELRHELWFGLGLVDTAAFAYGEGAYQERYYPNAPLLVEARDRVLEREAAVAVPSPVNQRSILGLQRQHEHEHEHERALRTAPMSASTAAAWCRACGSATRSGARRAHRAPTRASRWGGRCACSTPAAWSAARASITSRAR